MHFRFFCAPVAVSLAWPSRPVWPETTYMDAEKHRFFSQIGENGMAVLGWECLAKGFLLGRWTREDGLQNEQDTRVLHPVGSTAVAWRNRQLMTAYCTPENFARVDRLRSLASYKHCSPAQLALNYVLSQPYNVFTIVGTTNAAHFIDNAVAASQPRLTAKEIRWLQHGDGSSNVKVPAAVLSTPAECNVSASAASRRPSSLLFKAAAAVAGIAAIWAAFPTMFQKGVSSGGIDVRLTGASTDAGRVEVLHQGLWGHICPDFDELGKHWRWGQEEADVLCRQLGFGASTGTMLMPFIAATEAAAPWITGVSCTGHESSLAECSYTLHRGHRCPFNHAAGVRCLACSGEECVVGDETVTFLEGTLESVRQAVLTDDMAVAEPENAATDTVNGSSGLRCWNTHRKGMYQSSKHGLSLACRAEKYYFSSYGNEPSSTNVSSELNPFGPKMLAAFALRSSASFQKDVHRRHQAVDAVLRRQPWVAGLVQNLTKCGIRLTAVGIDATNYVSDCPGATTEAFQALRTLYLSPTSRLVWDLDRAARPWQSDTYNQAWNISRSLSKDGFAFIDSFGDLDIGALQRAATVALTHKALLLDKSVTSIASNGAVVSSRMRIPEVEQLLHNSTILDAVKQYLGQDAEVSGYKVVRLNPDLSEQDYIAGHWHNDRTGHRLKLYVWLGDVDAKEGHPTDVAVGSHRTTFYSFDSYEHSRYDDSYVRDHYKVKSLFGLAGQGFLLDTHAIHRGTPSGAATRDTLVVEYQSVSKCSILRRLQIPLPCPSGDQLLVPTPASAELSSSSASSCVSWGVANRGLGDGVELPNLSETLCLSQNDFVSCSSDQCKKDVSCQVAQISEKCDYRWRKYGYDVIPIDEKTVFLFLPFERGICWKNDRLGFVRMTGGNNDGACVLSDGASPSVLHGEYSMLLAWPKSAALHASTITRSSSGSDSVAKTVPSTCSFEAAVDRKKFIRYIGRYLSSADCALIFQVTGTKCEEMVSFLTAELESSCSLASRLLSMERVVSHPLNAKGLHLFRCLLAERMNDRRRFALGLTSHPDYSEWHRNGILLRDFNQMMQNNASALRSLLSMAVSGDPVQKEISFVAKQVVHLKNDTQTELHQDTFHQSVKMWVYDSSLQLQDGPLHYVFGSHRHTKEKLQWIFQRTAHHVKDTLVEPSLRFRSDSQESSFNLTLESLGFAEAPILPLPQSQKTLVIADTSGLHRRGLATPGRVRVAMRPKFGDSDGGVQRLNPFSDVQEFSSLF
mmetsp:Transcript_65/g.103  ORF Transcript_65/g.103 Transcript_65/m.103 type:complete len:1250 (+) Transcript_65:58-3807(+)